ncbi:MAG: hypothetical protein DHS20C11_13300 [Lysobacteraceae bacterium]|nr:MAG: hypothetical protein DHS20C11_13300 [Xanthomonadaceae bacterium]
MSKHTTTYRFDENTMKAIDMIRKNTGATTNTEVLRMALKLLAILSEASNSGKEIYLEKGDERERVII